MNGRVIAAEVTGLVAAALWVYSGTALAVAALGDGASVSIWAPVAVVGLSYGLARLLQGFDVSEGALRLWGVGLSVGLLYLILRTDIVGDPYVWQMGWLVDLFSEPGRTLEGREGAVTEVVLLGAAWVWGTARGARESTFDGLLGDVSLGLLVVLPGAAFAPAADAPGALRWLPVPYMAAGLLALALAHLGSVEVDRRRPFLGVWTTWTGGSLGIMAGLAVLVAFWDPPSMEAVGRALAMAADGVALLVVYVLTPFVFVLAWVIERLMDWLAVRQDMPEEALEPIQMGGPPELLTDAEEGETALWAKVLGYVLRSGVVVLVIVFALAILWFAFQRFSRRREDDVEVREEVMPGEGGPLGDLRALFAGALGRLRGRATGGPRGRDAIGRLYFSVLRRASARGLPRPPAATPLEFAPRLEEHFGSPVPGEVSRAYAEARYGRRPRPRREVERLRSRWEEDARDAP